jgi:hypothetical protein
MKQPLFILALLITLSSSAQSGPDSVAKFQPQTIELGKIPQGKPVTTYIQVTNISKAPVVVENVWGSCGCTVPDQVKDPIMPGKTTKVKVVYNAAAIGHFSKTVNFKLAGITTIKAITITGDVQAPEESGKQKGKTQ